ncbi:endosialin-like [Hypanus sabinus]|uniref:endosialin-like n=1 Tax=Hypanus sabinus TaxID=79690 RepID=UPI0028C46034|nr:endosialin-like [Hypanus sabinus]
MFALWLGLSCLLPPASGSPSSGGGEPGASNGVCGPDSCYTAHLRRRSFTQAWRACRETGGNLASVRRRAEAALVEELVRGLELPGRGKALKLWLGLQRQPRQCAPRKPLRGFTWTTGDQDTRFTNWLGDGAGEGEDGGISCPAARCVALTYGAGDATDFKWVEGSCRLSVDGYLCRYTFRGMCPPLEAFAPVTYAAPFGLTLSSLRRVPFGSVATVRCAPPQAPVSVLCKAREGGVGWSRDPPHCRSPGTEQGGRCAAGGCEQLCTESGSSHRCGCRAGFELAPDGRSCRDVDECALEPCPQLCTNAPGSYTCLCAPGYRLDGGECRDVDECALGQCPQLCANAPGSYRCFCRVGYRLERDEGGVGYCQDVDECQFRGSCQQMCVNYLGHFECHCREGFVLEPDGFSCLPEPERASLPSFPTGTVDGWREAAAETGRPSPLPTRQPVGMGRSPAVPTGGPAEVGPPPSRSTGQPGVTGPTPFTSTGRPKVNGQVSPISTGQPQVHDPHVPDSMEQSGPKSPGEKPLPQSTRHPKEMVYPPAQATEASVRAGPLLNHSSAHPAEHPSPAGDSDGEEGRQVKAGPTAPSRGQSSRGYRWLLAALLVPVCVLGAAALALGIVYCTRSACGQARSAADCYRWVHGSPKVPDPVTGSANVSSAVSVADTPGAAPAWRTDVSSL